MSKKELFDYQVAAIEKLKKIKVSALFMEQGLGKTITALELVRMRFTNQKVDKLIWLCPCSIKNSIKDMIVDFLDNDILKNVIICGIETLSTSIKTNVYLLDKTKSHKCFLVVDESLLIKNHNAIRTENIKRLSKNCEYKLLLNGTPISNSIVDLFSQFYILDWRILGYKSFWSFQANHIQYDLENPNKIVRCLNEEYISKKIEPYVYQVKRSECIKLPDKKYMTRYFEMTEEQKEHYFDVANKMLLEVDEIRPESIYRMFSALQSILSGFRIDEYENHIRTSPFFVKNLENPRLKKLIEIINDEKTIIYCKYTHEINDVMCILSEMGKAVRFDGKISQKRRMKNLEEFKNNATYLVANKNCAAFGLNLQFCNQIIYYDNDWSLATRLQSEDRTCRIGQQREVLIQDICCTNSLDERIKESLEKKENILECLQRNIKKNQKEYLKKWLFIDSSNRKNSLESIIDLKEEENV